MDGHGWMNYCRRVGQWPIGIAVGLALTEHSVQEALGAGISWELESTAKYAFMCGVRPALLRCVELGLCFGCAWDGLACGSALDISFKFRS